MKINFATAADFYKVSHKAQQHPGMTEIYSNFTPRSAHHANIQEGERFEGVVAVGTYGMLREIHEGWQETFFDVEREKAVNRYRRRCVNALGGYQNVDHLYALHDLGYLPIEVRAIEEGNIVPVKVPVFTVRSTSPDHAWIVGFLEDQLSSLTWQPMTNATNAYRVRKILEDFHNATHTPLDMLIWLGHDFAMRGNAGLEAAARNIGHLASFAGTDNILSIDYAEDYYGADSDKEMIGGSVPATEHSITASNIIYLSKEFKRFRETGEQVEPNNEYYNFAHDMYIDLSNREAGELRFLAYLLMDVYPTGILSFVSDTFDYWKLVNDYLRRLKPIIMARDGKLVIRPDSGTPELIINGEFPIVDKVDMNIATWNNQSYVFDASTQRVVYLEMHWNEFSSDTYSSQRIDERSLMPEHKGTMDVLWDIFGGTTNEAGYRTLDSHIGLIYGDSITIPRLTTILKGLKGKMYAPNNVVFGLGSYFYQYNTRDTYGFAMKATFAVIDGERVDVVKDPKTSDGTKKSASGLLKVVRENGRMILLEKQESEEGGELKLLYRNGEFLRHETLHDIRKRLHNWDARF